MDLAKIANLDCNLSSEMLFCRRLYRKKSRGKKIYRVLAGCGPRGTGGCLVARETKGNKTKSLRRKAKKKGKKDNKKMRSSAARKRCRSRGAEGGGGGVVESRPREREKLEAEERERKERCEGKRDLFQECNSNNLLYWYLQLSGAGDVPYPFSRHSMRPIRSAA